eukprot:3173481-Amphidinium_carterae.3
MFLVSLCQVLTTTIVPACHMQHDMLIANPFEHACGTDDVLRPGHQTMLAGNLYDNKGLEKLDVYPHELSESLASPLSIWMCLTLKLWRFWCLVTRASSKVGLILHAACHAACVPTT